MFSFRHSFLLSNLPDVAAAHAAPAPASAVVIGTSAIHFI